MKNKTINNYSEFELINAISKKIPINKNKDLILGSGDDSAIYKTSKNVLTVTSIDSFVENIHWKQNNQNYFNIRYQIKPFMIWIWLSTFLISLSGLIGFFKKRYEN